MSWKIIYEFGPEKPVKDFVKSLNKKSISRITRALSILQEYGNFIRMPYSKKLTKDVYELRIKGVESIRILYAFGPAEKIYLLHGFKKKTQKVPPKEIKLAETRLKRYLTSI